LIVRVDGVQYTKTVDTRTKREALAMLPAFIAEIQSGALAKVKAAEAKAAAASLLSTAIDEFLADEVAALSESTQRAYRFYLGKALALIGDKRVSEVTRQDIRTAVVTVNRESAANTVTHFHVLIGRFFRWLVVREVLSESPVRTLREMKIGKPANKARKRVALSDEDQRALVAACGEDEDSRLWIFLMSSLALRPGEALALRWQDVDLRQATVTVAHSVKHGRNGQGVLGTTKNEASERTIPMHASVAAVLEQAWIKRAEMYRSIGLAIAADDCIIPADLVDARKAPKTMFAMNSRFQHIRKRAALPSFVSPHLLRHSALTAMIAGTETTAGVSFADAARMAGHKNATMVAKVYGHATAGNMLRAAGLASAALTGAMPEPENNVVPLPRRGVSQ
jgi:integrase